MEGKNFLYNIIGILILGGAGYIAWRCGAFGRRVPRIDEHNKQLGDTIDKSRKNHNDIKSTVDKLSNDNRTARGYLKRIRDILKKARDRKVPK